MNNEIFIKKIKEYGDACHGAGYNLGMSPYEKNTPKGKELAKHADKLEAEIIEILEKLNG